jgi:hypothetical protein
MFSQNRGSLQLCFGIQQYVSQKYLKIVVCEVLKEIIVLYHDQAHSHTAQPTRQFLQASGVKLLDHRCGYSLHGATCDFFLSSD